ncbi:MAG: HAD family phosphatase [Lachnospiraceae bacterium]|nr:HAD family phosphatase [Lachnospiraceae bacterium]
MLKDIKAVLFDLDGSLVDSMWLWRDIDIEYLARFGVELPEDLQSCIEGMSFSETAAYIKERFQIPVSVEDMKQDWNTMALDKYSHEVPLKGGAEQFLNYCKERNIKLGIATSNSVELVTAVLNALKIKDYFTAVVTGCEVAKGKPAPDVYLEAAKRCDTMPEHCLVFEDIVAGITAGKAAGMRVCAVDDIYSRHQLAQKKQLADYFIHDYYDIFGEAK